MLWGIEIRGINPSMKQPNIIKKIDQNDFKIDSFFLHLKKCI